MTNPMTTKRHLLDALDRFNDIGDEAGQTREEKEIRSRDYTALFNFITDN